MKRYIVTQEAENDLNDIAEYLVEQADVAFARNVIRRIHRSLEFLNRTPGAGHLREDLTDAPVKFWLVFSYMIVYQPGPGPITVVRIIHSSRETAPIFPPAKGN